MTKMQRIKKILHGLLLLICSVQIFADPELGFGIVALILSLSLLLYSIRTFFYYLTMARHMVGGKSILYTGVIIFDLAVFIISMVDNPTLFIIVYLLGVHTFTGAVDILNALEERRYQASSWRRNMISGIANIAVAVSSVIAGMVVHSEKSLVYLYAICLLYTACFHIFEAFRKTAIIYIQ